MDQDDIEALYREAAEKDRAVLEENVEVVKGAVQEAVGSVTGNEQLRAEGERKKVEGQRQRLLGSVGHTLVVAGRSILSGRTVKPAEASSAAPLRPSDSEDVYSDRGRFSSAGDSEDEELTSDNLDLMRYNIAKWRLRRDVPLAVLAWVGVFYIVLMSAQHVERTLLILIIAALLAYALSPAVTLFERLMPRALAITLVYVIVLGGIGALLFFIVQTALQQVNQLSGFLAVLLTPGGGTLNGIARSVGLQPSQIEDIRRQILVQAQSATGSILPFVTGLFGTIVDIIIVAVLSIYFLIDGRRVTNWLRRSAPRHQRGRVGFALDTVQRIVGGYIRGQIFLCTLIGLLVGIGMALFHVPYALLLGVLAFILEFIPILGTLVSGAICILLALTNGWIWGLVVLVYFIGVHIIEGDIVGPRIVGKAVGLHPIVALAALIAGGELFGIWGSLFASPIAGVLQAALITVWIEWRERHPREFQQVKKEAVNKVANHVPVHPVDQETADKLLP